MSILIVSIFGVFSLIGGAIGYFKAGSMASLIAGGISGLILLACAFGMKQGMKAASIVALVVALALGARFLGTYLQSHKIMPDLIMIVLSAITLITLLLDLFKKK